MKLNFKLLFFLTSVVISAQLNAGPYFELCKQEAQKMTENKIQELQKYMNSKKSDWLVKQPFCKIGSPRDIFVYVYHLKPEFKQIRNVESLARADRLKQKQVLRKTVCNEASLSQYIKFVDIEYLYKYNQTKDIVSLRYSVDDCTSDDLARKSFDKTKESKEHLKRTQKDAKDAMQIYN